MYLENIVVDALDPRRLGRFWEAALDCEPLTDAPGIFETRLGIADDAYLDLCFQQVPEAPSEPVRLHLDLAAGAHQSDVVERLLGLGADHLDIGQHEVPWVVLADPEGNPCCVMDDRTVLAHTGPVAGLPLDSADPDRDAAFWAWLTGWRPVEGSPRSLRHSSGRGPVLSLCPEEEAKAAKNRMHLDVRLEPADDVDAVAAGILERGGREFHPGWGDLPWRHFQDPSGNEVCLLRAPS